jgi:tetratricopeptide (TPR) repeat protein
LRESVLGIIRYCHAEMTLSVNPQEGYALLDDVIAFLEADGPSRVLLWAYALRGNLYYENALLTPDESDIWICKAIDVAETIDAHEEMHNLRFMQGSAAMWRGDYDEARRHAEDALTLARQYDRTERELLACQDLLGHISYYAGDLDDARARITPTVEDAHARGDLWSLSRGRIRMTKIARQQGDRVEAQHHAAKLIRAHVEHGQDWQVLGGIFGLASFWYLETEQEDRAVALLGFVQAHPLTARIAREAVSRLLDEVRAALDDDARFEAARTALVGHTLEDVIASILAELEGESS